MKKIGSPHVIGLDFGSDSVRAILINTKTGQEVSSSVVHYLRWMKGLYCQPDQAQFRHHPQDYLDSMTDAIQGVLAAVPESILDSIVGIGIDTTASTPAPVDKNGTILALLPEFEHNPNAMFVLWKDHTSVEKSDLINQLSHSGNFTDYTRYVGGTYSSEWFWAKAAWVNEQDERVAQCAYSWVELCDWIPAVLSGNQHPKKIRRSVCAAGHKAMWHKNWNGLPDQAFLTAISPTLDDIRSRISGQVFTSDRAAGYLSSKWAADFGLKEGITIAVGGFDCHMGSVGAGAGENDLVKVIGTSTCDILMVDPNTVGDRTIRGICGQVQGSAVPELLALEAGQSAFGDIYAWFRKLLMWPLQAYSERRPELIPVFDDIASGLIPMLSQAAEKMGINQHTPVAMDWINGRRSPHADQRLKGALCDLNLGSVSPVIFSSLVESTAHGAKAIVDCFIDQGITVERIIAIGGIAQKSPYVMQMCADVIDREIAVVESDQCCALGAAIFAAVASGTYEDTKAAQLVMASRVRKTYVPSPSNRVLRAQRYTAYQEIGGHIEQIARFHCSQEQEK